MVDWGNTRLLNIESVALSGMERVSMAVVVAPGVNPTSDTVMDPGPV